MNARHIALVAGFAVVLGALVVLLVEVNASPELEVPEEALAQAQARYERRQSARQARSRVATPPAPSPAAARRTAKQPKSTTKTRPQRRFHPRQPPAKHSGGPRPDKDPARVAQIRRAYDYQRFDEALDLAEDYLQNIDPEQHYVRRVAVTSACALGEEEKARSYFAEMSARDQRIVRQRCSRYSFEL